MTDSSLRGRCKEMAEAACAADTSLRLVRGHYYDPAWGKQQHWWCERADGSIYDPTAAQFPSNGDSVYEEFSGVVECEQCGKQMQEEEAQWAGRYPVCSGMCYYRLVM